MAKVLSLVAFAVLASAVAVAREDDPVRAKLDDARAAYEADVKKARDELTKALEQKLDARKSAGDLDLVKKTRAELDLFSAHGVMPESVGTQGYKAAVRQARERYAAVLKEAEKEYTRASNLDAAEAVRDDLLQVQSAAGEERSAELAKAVAGYAKVREKARDDLLAGFDRMIGQAMALRFCLLKPVGCGAAGGSGESWRVARWRGS